MKVSELRNRLQKIEDQGYGGAEIMINCFEYTVEDVVVKLEDEDYPTHVEIVV